jgi:deoxycytidylate deaminase
MVHENELKIAFSEALKSPIKSQYGAVLTYRGKIVSKGYNDDRKLIISSNNRCCLL